MVFLKKAVLKISQISRENTCVGFFLLMKMQPYRMQLYLKGQANTYIFLGTLQIFFETRSFLNHMSSAASAFQYLPELQNFVSFIFPFFHAICPEKVF